jgi:N-acylglucosamine-6-phosphate 2-epimerase
VQKENINLTMNDVIKKLEKKVIISCQASEGEPFHDINCLMAMVKAVINGGASGLRLAGERDIKEAKKLCDVPVIGITKPEPLPENWKEIVYITPTYEDVEKIRKAGADIVAMDGTSRPRPDGNLAELIYYTQTKLNAPVMVDISTLEEGLMCRLLGADIISTTLSGYTTQTLDKNNNEPDFELLQKLVEIVDCPVILEGRVWTPEHVKKAFNLGAYAVVIGSAVTRPHLITERFVKAIK